MSSIPPIESDGPFSRFEHMVMSQLHTMENDHRSHHQFCETRFQNIEDLVEDVQYKIGQMFYGPEEEIVLIRATSSPLPISKELH